MSLIADNLRVVRQQIQEAASRSGRTPAEITLVAVSKGFEAGSIDEAVALGQKDFGENKVQELSAKAQQLPDGLNWHFVGRLQRNKVSRVLVHRPVIHSIDRLEVAQEIARRAVAPCEVLVEINVSGEATKAGVTPEQAPDLIRSMMSLPSLDLLGLMTMAPLSEHQEGSRPYFKALAGLKESLETEIPGLTIHHLSMGMSQDYVVAVEEGATIVRIGEAIFGMRRYGRSMTT